MTFNTILFDLDGTIVNTPELIMNSFIHAVNTHSNHKLTKSEITNVLGQTLDKAFQPFANDLNHLNKMIQSFRDYSLTHGDEVMVYDGVYQTLDYLKENNYTLGIVTSKSGKIANKNLEDLNLKKYFDVVITYEDTKLHKPTKEPLIYALNKLNKTSLNAIYIGDHENDVSAGKNANMKTGLMKYSHRLTEALKLKPDYVFEQFSDILKIVK